MVTSRHWGTGLGRGCSTQSRKQKFNLFLQSRRQNYSLNKSEVVKPSSATFSLFLVSLTHLISSIEFSKLHMIVFTNRHSYNGHFLGEPGLSSCSLAICSTPVHPHGTDQNFSYPLLTPSHHVFLGRLLCNFFDMKVSP